ncbi:MAG: hypothetical protein NT166_01915 [Candidatus Aminicenantes bacterium]|nr:hypothetical protein [Candidatus Aminicenantes bacterium]
MKRFTRIMLIVIMFSGICFSVFNFLSVETKAVGFPIRGALVYSAGQYRCMGDGADCTIGMFEPKE